ncbi:MAG: autotransporter outer membrane beta-barrel domain-containing protein [Desulfovibrio sp.]|jgi:hypothetical protein|nr:autotransporter outer membrane beta-barrel domain-containing protein [Desulfovibrio sp.]
MATPPVSSRKFAIAIAVCTALLLLLAILPVLRAMAADGIDSIYILNLDGNAVFRLDLYNKGMPYAELEEGTVSVSAADFSDAFKADMVEGLRYWAQLLKPHRDPNAVAVIRSGIAPDTDYNASAIFLPQMKPEEDEDRSAIWAALFGSGDNLWPFDIPDDPIPGAHSLFKINNFAFDTAPNSNIPETRATLAPTVVHEIGHALGFSSDDTRFSALLGNESTLGSPTDGHMFFWGETAMSVFNDMNGAQYTEESNCNPIPMAHFSNEESSHFGIRNGLMTHAQPTNFVSLMEVELASFIDIGYEIDLRSYYGLSLYKDNEEVVPIENEQGFYESKGLDGDGTWLGYNVGKPNTTDYGVGLHIYGSKYNVTQNADIYADGNSAAGVRVDGFSNTVTISKDRTVTANGYYGTGILVSFGADHVINTVGNVWATGASGIAARFDFGAKYIAEEVDDAMVSYGTYPQNICPQEQTDCQNSSDTYIPIATPGENAGPLVKQFNVQGQLIGGPSNPDGQILSGESVNYGGRPIAIYIGPSAHVQEINFMNGAQVVGDIISRWDPNASPVDAVRDDPTKYMTALTFGLKADGLTPMDPRAGDPDFSMSYRGNITGPASLDVSLEGGALSYSGTMTVNSFAMASGATLSTAFHDGQAAVIDAREKVTLAPDSHIAYQPSAFTFGDNLGSSPSAVTFTNARPETRAILDQSSGNFSVGPFDYSYNGLAWNEDNSAVVLNITRNAFNDSRGGTDAQNIPLPAILRTPGNAAVNERSIRRFSGSTRNRTAPTGSSLAQGTGEFGHRGTVARSANSYSAFSGLAAAIPELQWRSVGDGGWEAQDGRSGVWVAPSYGILQHHGGRKYTMNGPGVTFGADHRMSDNFFLGAALALDFPRINSADAKMRAWSTTGILYGGIELPLGLEFGFSGFFGGMHYYRERTYGNATHHSEFDSKILGVGANLGRRFEVLRELVVRPFVSWEFDHVDRGPATENDDVYALHYEAGTSTLHRLQAGADASWDFGFGTVGGRLYWSGIRWDHLGDSRFSFVMDREGNSFNAPIDALDRDSLGAALNFSMRPTENTTLTLEYSLLTGASTTSHLLTAGFRFAF